MAFTRLTNPTGKGNGNLRGGGGGGGLKEARGGLASRRFEQGSFLHEHARPLTYQRARDQ